MNVQLRLSWLPVPQKDSVLRVNIYMQVVGHWWQGRRPFLLW